MKRTAGEVVRLMSGQKLVEEDAERIDIALRRYVAAVDLLGRSIVGRHHPQHRCGRMYRLMYQVGIEDLCYPEIEQLRRTCPVDQNVAGLNVAMDYFFLVRVVERRADFLKQLETRLSIQLLPVGVIVKRLALDELHYEIRNAVA